MTTVWTIGHSTRPVEAFIESLAAARIELLVDIRRFPASRRNPQYCTDPLRRSLFQAKMGYLFLGDELGGYRKPHAGSPHLGLRAGLFRGYADWMETEGFARGIARLVAGVSARRVALMCAESAPASCHRKLLSDHLALVEGFEVLHLHEAGVVRPHDVTPGATRVASGLVYRLVVGAAPLERFSEPKP